MESVLEKFVQTLGLPESKSIDDVQPIEEGGAIARSGFTYQDEIAVSFLIEMLECDDLLEVLCETHDDILLKRLSSKPDQITLEFVQVKSTAIDGLWSVAKLCERKNARPGTAIIEKSIGHYNFGDKTQFRIVTLRDVNRELRVLKFPMGAPGREVHRNSFLKLHVEVNRRIPELTSSGDKLTYWIKNCLLDVRNELKAVQSDNERRLLKLANNDQILLLPEHIENILLELRYKAKLAGDAKWESNREDKVFTQSHIRTWWTNKTHELLTGFSLATGKKLKDKMTDAEIPADLIYNAIESRINYSKLIRTTHYLETDEITDLQSRVKSELQMLRSGYYAGDFDMDGIQFHNECLKTLRGINSDRMPGASDHFPFLLGCMYDMADRCLLRFNRPNK